MRRPRRARVVPHNSMPPCRPTPSERLTATWRVASEILGNPHSETTTMNPVLSPNDKIRRYVSVKEIQSILRRYIPPLPPVAP
ncbi:MAG: hypothetical protein U0790_01095 [Isosphaeraceae bacterium]